MLPGFGIPLGDSGWNWEVFTPNQSAASEVILRPWVRPPGINWVYVLAVGAGGAGGSGFTGAAAANRGGGGGGGAGAVSSWLLPAFMCPSMLYLRPGRGGIPGGTGSSASIVTPRSDGQTNGAFISVGSGNAGGNGTGSAAGAAGTAGGLSGVNNKVGLGSFTTVVGSAGAAGGAHTGAVGGSQFPGDMVSGGAGGAGVSATGFDGGAVNPNANMGIQMPSVLGGSAASPGGSPGLNLGSIPKFGQRLRYDVLSNIFGSGGGGGRSENSGAGGRGGDGGPGSGGGGGGAGTTGGLGGRGGDGFILVGWL